MVEYDATHVTGRLTTQEIAEAIRHKKYGVDMRETLAQGFEYMFNWYETLQKLQDTVENLNTRVETLEENVSNLSEDITDLRQQHKQDVDALTKEINGLNKTIEKQDARISKLEGAVFNAVYINDTDEQISDTTPVSEDINDTHALDDDNAVIIEESDPSLPHDIN